MGILLNIEQPDATSHTRHHCDHLADEWLDCCWREQFESSARWNYRRLSARIMLSQLALYYYVQYLYLHLGLNPRNNLLLPSSHIRAMTGNQLARNEKSRIRYGTSHFLKFDVLLLELLIYHTNKNKLVGLIIL